MTITFNTESFTNNTMNDNHVYTPVTGGRDETLLTEIGLCDCKDEACCDCWLAAIAPFYFLYETSDEDEGRHKLGNKYVVGLLGLIGFECILGCIQSQKLRAKESCCLHCASAVFCIPCLLTKNLRHVRKYNQGVEV
jgi:hypothetical protein